MKAVAHSESLSPPVSPFCPLGGEEEDAESLEVIFCRVWGHLQQGYTVQPSMAGCCGILELPLVSRVLEEVLRDMELPIPGSSPYISMRPCPA